MGTIAGPPLASELPDDLEQFAFGKFSSVYCNGVQLMVSLLLRLIAVYNCGLT